jgi:DNA-binding NarL/FixJ family response regulator
MVSRILVAGSQPVLRDAIRALLEQGGFCVVGVASNADDAVEMARRSHPDVTVLDASAPGPNAVEIVRRIQGGWAQTRVLLLDGKGDDLRNAEHFAEGIAGLVGKNDAPGDFIQAVAEVSTRRLQPDSRWRPTAPCRRRKLSRRQREVLAMIAGAKSTREIAAHIGVSPKTVESHRSSIMEKLDIHDVATLVRFAMRHGLAGPPAQEGESVAGQASRDAVLADASWRTRGAAADAARTVLHAR